MQRPTTALGYSARFQSLHRTAYLSAFPVLGDAADCQDVAQEALARAFVRWDRIEPHAAAWVSRVAFNLAIDATRRRRHVPADPTRQSLDAWAAERVDLQRALARLPRRQREAVYLRYMLDLSEADIATVLGISPGTVKTHSARGLAALRDLLDDSLEAPHA